MLKKHIQQLLAADEIGEAIDCLLATDLGEKTADFKQEVIMHSGQYQHYRKLVNQNTEDFADLVRIRNKVNIGLLQLTDELAEDLPIPEQKEKKKLEGVSENKLKNRLLWLVACAKLLVIAFVYTLWESGSFTNDQFMATVTLLVPVFVTYLSLMMKDQVERRHLIAHPDKRVKKSFERMTYALIVIYALVLLIVINLRGPGTISFNQMNGFLALVESGLGVYVTQVIFTLFKKK